MRWRQQRRLSSSFLTTILWQRQNNTSRVRLVTTLFPERIPISTAELITVLYLYNLYLIAEPSHALAEFIDNSIQATSNIASGQTREVDVSFYLDTQRPDSECSYLMIRWSIINVYHPFFFMSCVDLCSILFQFNKHVCYVFSLIGTTVVAWPKERSRTSRDTR